MNFSRALSYPFHNLPKVMSIVLAMTIAIAICLGLVANTYDWSPLVAMLYGVDVGAAASAELQPMGASTFPGVMGLLIVAAISGLWISGYSVDVVRSVMNGIETLPVIQFGRNLIDGFMLLIAGIAYGLLFVFLLVVEFALLSLTSSVDGYNLIVLLAALIVTIVALSLIGWAYLIGMARFAAEGDHKAAWQILRNIRLARAHWRSGATLLLYMLAFTLLYGVVRSLINTALGGFTGGFGIASVTLSIIIYYSLNLLQHFSTQHLIAQFATNIGIRSDRYEPGKNKTDAI